jgi:hypothetical protein
MPPVNHPALYLSLLQIYDAIQPTLYFSAVSLIRPMDCYYTMNKTSGFPSAIGKPLAATDPEKRYQRSSQIEILQEEYHEIEH